VHLDVDVAYAELTTDARSIATLVNSSAGFSCCTNASVPILWHFNYPYDNKVHVVYNGYSVHPALAPSFDVRFDSSSGCSQLTISGVRLGDAGTYWCLESNTARRKLRFELIAFGQY